MDVDTSRRVIPCRTALALSRRFLVFIDPAHVHTDAPCPVLAVSVGRLMAREREAQHYLEQIML